VFEFISDIMDSKGESWLSARMSVMRRRPLSEVVVVVRRWPLSGVVV